MGMRIRRGRKFRHPVATASGISVRNIIQWEVYEEIRHNAIVKSPSNEILRLRIEEVQKVDSIRERKNIE